MCHNQVEMLPHSLDPGARSSGLLCKFLTGHMDAMAINGFSCFENHKSALWLPRGLEIPSVGTTAPLAITTMLGNFTKKNLGSTVAADFATRHNWPCNVHAHLNKIWFGL